MEFIIIIALAVALVALAFIGLGIQILIKRGGKFPNTHVEVIHTCRNKEYRVLKHRIELNRQN